jgi:hypothetical protein
MLRSSTLDRHALLVFAALLATALSAGCDYHECDDDFDHDFDDHDDDHDDCRGPYCGDDWPRHDGGGSTRDAGSPVVDLGAPLIDLGDTTRADAGASDDGGAVEVDAGAPLVDLGPPPFCSSDDDCAAGSVCRSGVCRTPCPSGANDECRRYDAQLVWCRAISGENLCFAAGE